AVLAALFAIPFFAPAAEPVITWIYFGWAAVELVRMLIGRRTAPALSHFVKVWRDHVSDTGEGDPA
ncbi:MAG: hypothetical protein ABI833_08880, partial [Acidobacteriota bacterium]